MSVSMVSTVQPVSEARALRWWSREQQLRLALAMEKVLRAWEQDWGLEQGHPVEEVVRCDMAFEERGADEAAPVNWKPVSLDGASEPACELWWDWSPAARPGLSGAKAASQMRRTIAPDLVSVLLVALFGSPSEPLAAGEAAGVAELAAETAKSAWADLWRRIGHALQIAATTGAPSTRQGHPSTLLPAPQCFRPWSGAVVVTLHWCGQELRILVGGSEMEAFLSHHMALRPAAVARPSAVVPVWEAVDALTSTVRAELEPVELSLGTVKALRIGDVVGLPHPLDKPLSAKTATGELLCEVFLGKTGAHRAIELLRSPSRPF